MKISESRIRKIVRETIDAVDFFNNLNKRNGGLTSWDPETKMERMGPSNASCANCSPPSKDFKLHTYNDWVTNYKPKGISYQEYMQIKL